MKNRYILLALFISFTSNASLLYKGGEAGQDHELVFIP